jgi:transposase
MIYVGIDVAKEKHDCVAINEDGEILTKYFTFTNNLEGFNFFLERMGSITDSSENIKIGLEATGHYSYNLIGFLNEKGLTTFVLNPLHTNLFRQGLSLRKTKTDKVDSYTIALMITSKQFLKSYSDKSYTNEDLRSLTRYRFDLIQQRSKLKVSVVRLIDILFPELQSLVSNIHGKAIYQLLRQFPGAKEIRHAHLTTMTNLLSLASRGRFKKAKASLIREAARNSIGSNMPAKSFELKHTIKRIIDLELLIEETDEQIKMMIDDLGTTILSIPGIDYAMGAMIIAEIGSFQRFQHPDKILAFAGLSPSTYQSGKLESSYAKMEKRGSKYLRYALFNATKYVCTWNPIFKAYLA